MNTKLFKLIIFFKICKSSKTNEIEINSVNTSQKVDDYYGVMSKYAFDDYYIV